MRASSKTLSLVSVLPVLLLTACGDQSVLTKSEALACDADTFRVTGTIDGVPIDVSQTSHTGGFAQGGGGDFGSVNNTVLEDPTLADLHLVWTDDILTGHSAAASGTLSMPASGFPTDVFCVGAGTAVRVVPDAEGGGLQFRLAGLASGASCETVRAGELRGCWR